MNIKHIVLRHQKIRLFFQLQACNNLAGVKVELIKIILFRGKTIPADNNILFYNKIHGVAGLIPTSPKKLVIFQIIGEHETGIRLGIAVCHAGSIEDSVP